MPAAAFTLCQTSSQSVPMFQFNLRFYQYRLNFVCCRHGNLICITSVIDNVTCSLHKLALADQSFLLDHVEHVDTMEHQSRVLFFFFLVHGQNLDRVR